MQQTGEAQTSRLLYVLLAIGGGLFGAHNFYADRKRMAIFQLLLTVLSCGLLAGITFLTVLFDIFCYDPQMKIFHKKRCGLALCAFLLPLFLLLGGGYALYQHDRKKHCLSNICDISFALSAYAADYQGQFPKGDNDSGLLELELRAEQLFCPVEKERRYVYLGGANQKMGRCPIFFELPGGHNKNKTYVIYASGILQELDLSDSKTIQDILTHLEKEAETEEIANFLRSKKQLWSKSKKHPLPDIARP